MRKFSFVPGEPVSSARVHRVHIKGGTLWGAHGEAALSIESAFQGGECPPRMASLSTDTASVFRLGLCTAKQCARRFRDAFKGHSKAKPLGIPFL